MVDLLYWTNVQNTGKSLKYGDATFQITTYFFGILRANPEHLPNHMNYAQVTCIRFVGTQWTSFCRLKLHFQVHVSSQESIEYRLL